MQFHIFTNLANFKFNILFEQAVTTQIDKTSYLGKLYSLINLVSFIVQIILIPLMLTYKAKMGSLLYPPILSSS